MFLRILNDDQKRSLLVIAHHVVVSDHSVSVKEGVLLDELLNGLRTDISHNAQAIIYQAQFGGVRHSRIPRRSDA